MEAREALTWTLKYRGLSTVALVIGFAFVGLGFAFGLQEAASILVSEGREGLGEAAAAGAIFLVLTAIGVFIWQFGKTYAFFKTIPEATGSTAAAEVDTDHLKGDILEVLDDRLSDMQAELDETRRSVQQLKQAEYAAEFDEEEIPEPASPASGSSGSTAAGSSAASSSTSTGSTASGRSSTASTGTTGGSSTTSGETGATTTTGTASSSSGSGSSSSGGSGREVDRRETSEDASGDTANREVDRRETSEDASRKRSDSSSDSDSDSTSESDDSTDPLA